MHSGQSNLRGWSCQEAGIPGIKSLHFSSKRMHSQKQYHLIAAWQRNTCNTGWFPLAEPQSLFICCFVLQVVHPLHGNRSIPRPPRAAGRANTDQTASHWASARQHCLLELMGHFVQNRLLGSAVQQEKQCQIQEHLGSFWVQRLWLFLVICYQNWENSLCQGYNSITEIGTVLDQGTGGQIHSFAFPLLSKLTWNSKPTDIFYFPSQNARFPSRTEFPRFLKSSAFCCRIFSWKTKMSCSTAAWFPLLCGPLSSSSNNRELQSMLSLPSSLY